MSPSDIKSPTFLNGEQLQSSFNPNFNAQQRKQQRQQEIISEMEKAARNGDQELLSKIIEEGTNEDNIGTSSRFQSESPFDSNISSSQRLITRKDLNRALILAVQHCQATTKVQPALECINILLQAGANANCSDPQQDGKTVLMIASERGFIEIVESLLFNEECQINYKDSKQKTPLLYTLDNQAQNDDVVRFLIKKGADVNSISHDGYSPLLKATQKQFHAIMYILLEHGANSEQRHLSTQNTALHIACENGDLEAIKILIKNGGLCADLEALNREKETPIGITQRYASQSGIHKETYSYLKGVWDEREKKAQQAKDELVKHEEMQEEKERKKQRSKQTGKNNSQSTVGNKKNNSQAVAEDTLKQDIDIETFSYSDIKKSEGEELKISQKQHQMIQDVDFNLYNHNSYQQENSPQLQEIISNPLMNAICGQSPIIEYRQMPMPIAQPQQQTDPYNQKPNNQSTPQSKTYKQQSSYSNGSIPQQNSSSGKKPQNSSYTQSNSSYNTQGNVQQQSNYTSSQRQGNQGQNRQQYQYDNTSYNNMAANGGQSHNNNGSYNILKNSASKRVSLVNSLKQSQRQYSQSLFLHFYDQQQRRQSGNNSNNGQQVQSQNTVNGVTNKSNKNLPFITSPTIQSEVNRENSQSAPNVTTQIPAQKIPQSNQATSANGININPQTTGNLLGIQQQVTNVTTVQSASQLIDPIAVAAMLNQNAMQSYIQHLLNSNAQLFQPQSLGSHNIFQPGQQQQQWQQPQQQQPQVVPQQLQFLQQRSQQQYPQQFQLQNCSIFQPIAQPQSQSVTSTTINIVQQPLSASPPDFSIMDELDLSDSSNLKIFLMEQQLYQMQKQIDQKDYQIQIKQIEVENKSSEITALTQNLQKQDSEIEIHVKNIENLQGRIQQQEAQIINLQNEHKEKINEQNLHHSYQIDKVKEHCLEVERLLIKIHNVHKQTTDKIVKCYEERRFFNKEEIKEVEKNISSQQVSLNQLILTHKVEYNAQQQTSKQMVTQKPSQSQMTVLSTNKLVHMMERFEPQVPYLPHYNHSTIMMLQQEMQVQDQNDVYNKLHIEILQFRDSVKEILADMQPVKEQIIDKITEVIKRAVPHCDVRVYGSHATKLCLPWSDIDLVIITPSRHNDYMNNYNPKFVLSSINQELRNEVSNKWVSQVNYVDNATVPVVKVNCHIKDLMKHTHNNLLSQSDLEKYKVFLDQPFNIDITQMTDHHNGLECVSVVQEYLAENEIIEPLILVLKQLLKASSLNNPYFGGLSSYALFLLIVSYLQSHEQGKEIAKVNLGKVLISFLSFYGSFDHENIGVSCQLPLKRQALHLDIKPNQYPFLNFVIMPSPCIQIDDPLNPSNNVGKSSFKFFEIKMAFDYSQRVFFLGCFCDCHNTKLVMHDQHQHIHQFNKKGDSTSSFTMPGGTKDIVSHKRQCDSVLSRIIYSYKMFEQFFGPFHPMG